MTSTNIVDDLPEVTASSSAPGSIEAVRADYPLPLVSVIVVNYNYGDYVSEAIESVMAQTYPFVECIVIDDRSTDDSLAIIHDLQRKHPSIKVLVNERNCGQSLSSRNALEKSSGSHIIFVDADDFLLPTCVETHIITHLSLRVPVGFTSVDMLQVLNGRVVTTAFPCMAEFVRSKSERDPKLLRYLDLSAVIAEPALTAEQLQDRVYYAHPLEAAGWPWSPTSGNCFRREALQLIINNPDLEALRSCTDCYLLRGVAALTGSAIIDVPLVGYRLHGKNDFVRSGNLHRIASYEAGNLKTRSNQAMKMLIDYILDNAASFMQRLEAPSFFREALDALADAHPPIHETGLNYLNRQMLARRDELRKLLGPKEFDHWLAYRFIPPGLLHIPAVGFLLKTLLVGAIVPIIARGETSDRGDSAIKGEARAR